MYIVASGLLCLCLAFLFGYPVVVWLRVEAGSRRFAWGLVTGFALIVVSARTLQFAAPMAPSAWWMLGAGVVGATWSWCRAAVRRAVTRDLAVTGWRRLVVAAFCAAALCAALNAAAILTGAYLFEGTPNHDSFHYVANARWMLDHRFFDPVVYSREDPLFFIVSNFFGHGAILGRVGGDAVLAFTSAILGIDPLYAYNGVQSAALLVGIAASMLVPSRRFVIRARRMLRSGLAIPIFFVVPSVLQMALNSNFANIYGATFFAAFVAAFVNLQGRRRIIVSVIMAVALLASYPELFPVACGCMGIAFIVRTVCRQDSVRVLVGHGMAAVLVVASALLVAPWIAYAALPVIKNSYLVASTQGAGWPDGYAGFIGARYMAAYLTTSRQAVEMLPAAFSFLFVPLLVFLVGRSILRGERRLEAAVVICFVAMTLNIFINDFNYGKLKVVEYFSLFFAPLLLVGSARARLGAALDRHSLSVGATYFVIIGCLVATSFPLVRDGIVWGSRKQISQELIEVSRGAKVALSDMGALSVETTHWGYFYSMWIPYLTRAPVVLPIPSVGGGGYLAPYLATTPLQAKVPEMAIRNAPARFDLAPPRMKAGQFALFEIDGEDSKVDGLHADEPDFTWMGDSIKVDVHAREEMEYLNFSTSHRFNADTSVEVVGVAIDGDVTCDVEFATLAGSMSLPLRAGPAQVVTIAPRRGAQSPAELGMSTDSRELTYAVRQISISDEPLHQVATCDAQPRSKTTR